MRGLRKYLTPFAPDQSGAVSVLYELGGLLAICDAGGCTGNVCGFDEPRWFEKKSALFSAGLRDMDAILGRDDKLVGKLTDAASRLDVKFAAIIGTPVPAVIGTDYRALAKMCRKKLDIPVITVDTDGMELYDKGEEKAWLTLFQTFAEQKEESDRETSGKIGILGLTPQDTSDLHAPEKIQTYYREKEQKEAVCYGMGAGLDKIAHAGENEKNIVVAPAALEAARYLEKTFGTPYEAAYPIAEELVPEMDYQGKKILVVHQQVTGNAIRDTIRHRLSEKDADITVAGWFMMKPELKEKGDLSLKEEDDYMELIEREAYDIVFADPMMRRMTEEACKKSQKECRFVCATHFAVSGKLRGQQEA